MGNYDDILNIQQKVEQRGTQLSSEEYAEKKRAERDRVFELSCTSVLEVTNDGGKFKQFLDAQSHFDRYSAVNTLLIIAQKPDATRIGNYDYWKDRGGFIKKDEKGISILEPQEYEKEDGTQGVGYNIKKMFDISQINTRKMKPDPMQPTYDNRHKLQALISNAPVKITAVDTLAGSTGAKTDNATGEIKVRKGMEFEDFFKSLSQELALAQMNMSPENTTNSEFSAYCASYLLCKKYDVDAQSFDFTDSPNVLGGLDERSAKGELQKIRDVFVEISERMEQNFDLIQQEKAAKSQDAR